MTRFVDGFRFVQAGRLGLVLAVFSAAVFVTGCGESAPTPPAAPAEGKAEGGDLPILKNSAKDKAKNKTTEEDTDHRLRSKNRKKD